MGSGGSSSPATVSSLARVRQHRPAFPGGLLAPQACPLFGAASSAPGLPCFLATAARGRLFVLLRRVDGREGLLARPGLFGGALAGARLATCLLVAHRAARRPPSLSRATAVRLAVGVGDVAESGLTEWTPGDPLVGPGRANPAPGWSLGAATRRTATRCCNPQGFAEMPAATHQRVCPGTRNARRAAWHRRGLSCPARRFRRRDMLDEIVQLMLGLGCSGDRPGRAIVQVEHHARRPHRSRPAAGRPAPQAPDVR